MEAGNCLNTIYSPLHPYVNLNIFIFQFNKNIFDRIIEGIPVTLLYFLINIDSDTFIFTVTKISFSQR